MEASKQALRLGADQGGTLTNLVNCALGLQRFDEAQQLILNTGRGMDDAILHNAVYALAFLHADSAAMAEQQQWLRRQPDYENYGLALASDTEAYAGRARQARELTQRAANSALKADSKENGAI